MFRMSYRMVKLAVVGVVFAAVAFAVPVVRAVRQAPPSWSSLNREIRQTFPSVQHVSTDELARRLVDDRPPILLDIREREEFAVSSLPNARLATTAADALALIEGIPRDRAIVVYCSVGYRSADVARQLMAAGFSEVYNLEGSIFAWANEGRSIVRGNEVVGEVHPFNRKWGQLLERSLWAETVF